LVAKELPSFSDETKDICYALSTLIRLGYITHNTSNLDDTAKHIAVYLRKQRRRRRNR
jgi:hypothetical protein